MTDRTTHTQCHVASVGASRQSDRFRPSIEWSINSMVAVTASKAYAAPVANKAFGDHLTTIHPRPEEAPL